MNEHKREAARVMRVHADRIEKNELRWRNTYPEAVGECCIGFWMVPGRANPYWERQEGLPEAALYALCDLLGLDVTDPSQPGTEEPGVALGEWNDAPERTQDEVLAALRFAALSLDGQTSHDSIGEAQS